MRPVIQVRLRCGCGAQVTQRTARALLATASMMMNEACSLNRPDLADVARRIRADVRMALGDDGYMYASEAAACWMAGVA